ncbi:hypothetical protein ES703_37231 [subsurface metagenome]
MVELDDVPVWFKAVYWLAAEIEKIADCNVKVEVKKFGALGFYAPRNFAFVRKHKSGAQIKIDTKKDWAVKASVANKADSETENGWWGEPGVYWKAKVNDKNRLLQMAGILTRILKARHQ